MQFKDRYVGLIIFGALTILAGCICALFVPLVLFSAAVAAKAPNPPPAAPNVIPGAAIYALFAIVLVWLGIGSIRARRWARALLAIWSWSWLVCGVMGIITLARMLPGLRESIAAAHPSGQPALAPAAQATVIVVIFAITAVLLVLIPLVWALFYSASNVRATCEARDPVTRWTDRCPLPVLAASLWFAFGAVSMCIMPLMHSVAPFFGVILSGGAGTFFYLFLAAIWAYCGWRLYHLDLRGWWIVVVVLILFAISSVMTYSRHDLTEIYSRMGYGSEQAAQLQALMGNYIHTWSSLFFVVPALLYLLYIRKYFGAPAQER